MNVALVGNQNSGKSTLFNTLTGSNQKIGNWPGVTIEKKTGTIENSKFNIIDLPGIYSLKAYTEDEKITCDFICDEQIDIIINVIDCNSISRGLYLTMQLLELKKDMIIVLNMYELLEEKGIMLDEAKLSKILDGISVIKISALSGKGCDTLISEIKEIAKSKNCKTINDKNINKEKNVYKLSLSEDVKQIEERYKNIDKIIEDIFVDFKPKKHRIPLSDKIDKIFLNKYLAIPIFLAIMFIVYYVSIEFVGNNTTYKINNIINMFSNGLEKLLYRKEISQPLVSLLINGIINGVSAVISFLPQLISLFIFLSFLEKVGYMSRISLIFDKLFRKIGMSGNSIISFILGTGCSVSGIIATKTIKNEKEKKIAAILTPFIPCSAKLPIISLFSTYFFDENAGIVALSFYLLSIIVIIISAFVINKLNKNIENNTYLSELPEYRVPKLKYVLKDSMGKVIDFIKRTGSVILLSSIGVWFLLSFSIKLEYGVNIENSILASLGKAFSWIFIPMVGNNGWEIGISAIQGLIAKEQVISSMAIIAGLESKNVSDSIFAIGSPFDFFTPVSAYAFVCFNLFCAPCFGAIGSLKNVLEGNANLIKVISYQYIIAYIISCLIYNVGNVVIKVL